MKNVLLPSLGLVTPREVELHYKRPIFDAMAYVDKAERADFYIRKFINQDIIDFKEFFWTLFLNSANRILAFSEIGSGTSNMVAVNIKEIFQIALVLNASSIILCHNHPSGKLEISSSDKQFTHRVKESAALLSIELLDHLIITSESYLSFAEQGEL